MSAWDAQKKSTHLLNKENSSKEKQSQKAKIITKWWQMKRMKIKFKKSKSVQKVWQIADSIPRW